MIKLQALSHQRIFLSHWPALTSPSLTGSLRKEMDCYTVELEVFWTLTISLCSPSSEQSQAQFRLPIWRSQKKFLPRRRPYRGSSWLSWRATSRGITTEPQLRGLYRCVAIYSYTWIQKMSNSASSYSIGACRSPVSSKSRACATIRKAMKFLVELAVAEEVLDG